MKFDVQDSPDSFINLLLAQQITEAYFIMQNGQLVASHPALNDIAGEIMNWADFRNHEGIFFAIDHSTESLHCVCIYSTKRGQSAGGVRLNTYNSFKELVCDGLRLAKGMADKNAIARLWWGGGKGIIYRKDIWNLDKTERSTIYKIFGQLVTRLNGLYITAEDMHTKPADMVDIYSVSRYTTCIPVEIGGSSNPSTYTAKGVFSGIKAAAEIKWGKQNPLKGKVALLHGAGSVGYHVMEQLIDAGASVKVYDINENTCQTIANTFSKEVVSIVEDETAFFKMEANILSPNAIGAIINDERIANLKVDIIAGGANNQLLLPAEHAQKLHQKGIVFLPDFFINRLGIINCANEQYGYVKADIEKAVEQVYIDSLTLLKQAQDTNQTPFEIANKIAEKRLQETHPIWGHRGPALLEEAIKRGFGQKP